MRTGDLIQQTVPPMPEGIHKEFRPLSLDDIGDRQGGSLEGLMERPLAIDIAPESIQTDAPIDFKKRLAQAKALRKSLQKDETYRMLLSKAALLNRGLAEKHMRLASIQELGGEGVELLKAIDQERTMLGQVMTSFTAIK
jgi:hypothetical protein